MAKSSSKSSKSVTYLPGGHGEAGTRTGVIDRSGDYGRPTYEAVSDGYNRGYFSTPEAAQKSADEHGNPGSSGTPSGGGL
jgi:hypothetical protein